MAFKYISRTKEQINKAIETIFTTIPLTILPRAISHAACAGCFMRWLRNDDDILFLTTVYRTLIITSDKSDLVIVYEELPDILGGHRTIGIKYQGPKEELQVKTMFAGIVDSGHYNKGQTPPLTDFPNHTGPPFDFNLPEESFNPPKDWEPDNDDE